MEPLLLVFLLNIESSYLQNIERETASPADTVQFLLASGQAWRIKTYAIDHDVHVWSLGPMDRKKFEELANTNTLKNYGDVLERTFVVEGDGDFDSLKTALKGAGLDENLEVAKSKQFAFWVPQPNVYKTKSTPK